MPGDVATHTFQSAKGDGADATLVQPSSWNAAHRVGVLLTNKSGSQRVANDVCILDSTNDNGFTTTTTQADQHIAVVVQETINNNVEGLCKYTGDVVMAVQGAVTRGNFLRFSTTAGKAEDTGSAVEVDGAIALAITGFAGPGAGTIQAILLGRNARTAPTGAIIPYGSTTVPLTWLACDGAAVSRTTYAALFAIVGTVYGAGNGSTTFNVPDMRGRTIIGAGTGSGLTTRAIGAKSGEESHTLTTDEMPAHNHNGGDGAAVVTAGGGWVTLQGGAAVALNNAGTANTGGGTAHNTMPPFTVNQYIIRT